MGLKVYALAVADCRAFFYSVSGFEADRFARAGERGVEAQRLGLGAFFLLEGVAGLRDWGLIRAFHLIPSPHLPLNDTNILSP